MKSVIGALFLVAIVGCGRQPDSPAEPESEPLGSHAQPASRPIAPPVIDTRKTLKTIHVFVALCDNDSQGIVPVSKLLGNGKDPWNNLYWGAMYGTKTFLKRSKAWDEVYTLKFTGETVLRRMILKHRATGAYLVADAYQGAKIKQAIEAFFGAAAGNMPGVLRIDGDLIGTYGKADMIAFVGHNGLMDFRVTPPQQRNTALPAPAAIVLACYSKRYFRDTLAKYECKPMLLTTGRMAPEAYTLEAAIEAWLAGHGPQGVRGRAALAYNKYQKCGIRGATRLFHAE